MLWINTLLLIILLFIFFQDMRFQAVSWILFLIGFILIAISAVDQNIKNNLWINIAINISFISFQVLVVYLFTWFKFRKRVNIFKSVFGLGDLFFLIMIIPLFSPLNFVVFFVSSTFFTLLLYLLLRKIKVYKQERVPLAGLQSLFLTFILVLQFFYKLNLNNDILLIDTLNIL